MVSESELRLCYDHVKIHQIQFFGCDIIQMEKVW
jgi:hypothetical protein